MSTTENSLNHLIKFFAKKEEFDLLEKNDWVMNKKYKNYQEETCRDFYNEKYNKKSIVIEKDSAFEVIENENFLYFTRNSKNPPMFNYATFISQYNTTYLFVLSKNLKLDELVFADKKLEIMLLEKIKKIFPNTYCDLLDKDHMMIIQSNDINMVAEKLEQNNYIFSENIYKLFKQKIYQPFSPDPLSLKYHFPEDENKKSSEAIDTILNILSKQNISEEQKIRIKKLIKKVSLKDLNLNRRIAFDLNIKERDFTNDLFLKQIANYIKQ